MNQDHFNERREQRINATAVAVCTSFLALVSACSKPQWKTETGEFTRDLPNCEVSFDVAVDTIAHSLELPWNAAFLDSGDILFTERTGRLRIIRRGTNLAETLRDFDVAIDGVVGLTALAVRETSADDIELFVAKTVSTENGNVVTAGLRKLRNKAKRRLNRFAGHRFEVQISRLTLQLPDKLGDEEVILRLPASHLHGTGALEIGKDGILYAAVGDTNRPLIAQSDASLAGKIIRLRHDDPTGRIRPEVVANGLRNPQSMAWGGDERLFWATDHGDQGYDELNLIRTGGNYGWPYVEGQAADESEFRNPWVVWKTTIAPSSVEYFQQNGHPWDGNLFVTTLLGEALIRIETAYDQQGVPEAVCQESLLTGEYGRLRFVLQGPDGALYVGTSNHDYRGIPKEQDDRIFRVRLPGIRDEQWVEGAENSIVE